MFGIRLIRYGGMGDVCMALCCTKVLKEIGLYIEFFTAPAYKELAEACPYVDRVITNREEQQALLRIKQDYIENKNLSSVWHGICGMHEVDSFLQELRAYTPDENKQLIIDIKNEDIIKNKLKELGALRVKAHNKHRILIHPGISDPHRTWPLEYWNKLINSLISSLHDVIIIGASSSDGKDAFKIVLDLTNKLSLLETIVLMRYSDDLISCDSGPIQLAGATDIRIIGMYSVVKPEYRLPYRKNGISIGLYPHKCEQYPCFLKLHDTKSFQENRYMLSNKQVDFHNTLKNWCLNEDKYCCMKEITPQKILTISGFYADDY